MRKKARTHLVSAPPNGQPPRPPARLAALAVTLAATASITLPAVQGQIAAARAMYAAFPVPELLVALQSLPNSCGPAALATLAAWLGVEGVTESAVLTQATLAPSGMSLGEFARVASLHGIEGAWFQVAPAALGRLATPFAAHLSRDGQGHFVVVLHLSGQLALVADPAEGASVMSLASLAAEFSGRAFLLKRSAV